MKLKSECPNFFVFINVYLLEPKGTLNQVEKKTWNCRLPLRKRVFKVLNK